MYADDIILLSTSVTDLQKLFDLCRKILSDLDLPINYSKCSCMRIGPRHNVPCAEIVIDTFCIAWVNEINFLGITVCKSSKFVCSWTQAKRKCFYTSNVIFSKLGNSTAANVILKLVFTHGVQNLLYGIAALSLTSLTSAEVDSLAWLITVSFVRFLNHTIKRLLPCVSFIVGI